MEYSSPLAAMRPPPHPTWAARKDVPVSRAMYHGYQTYGPTTFDFKAMSMNAHRPAARHDYFAARPVRGSSPTASLTADLDANFHIDKTPQAPTPRRSLFTTDLFRPREDQVRLMTPPIEAEPTTPPVPLSSPVGDGMDISPLPHKAPFLQVILPSPTPETTPASDFEISPDLLSPEESSMPLACPLLPTPSFAVAERRRPVTRPSLFRAKALSANNILPPRPTTAQNQLPPFRFGDVASSGLSCSSTPSLLESFTQSPVDGGTPLSVQSMGPPARRPSVGAMSRTTGSPAVGHVRKPSGGRPAFVRPTRKLMRRSLSMFQHPDDVMKEEQEAFEPQAAVAASLTSAMDIMDQEHVLKLPHFIPDDEPDSLPRISQETMVDVLEAKYGHQYDRVLVVDCRFEYEYQGGHIENAVNFNDKQQLAHELFDAPTPSSASTLLILHCEYSVHRAPLTAKFLRAHDRNANAAHYPRLSYPELYILDGGYSQFFHAHRAKCFPQSYVEMNDTRHELACERGMAKVKQSRQRLFRHQTFAFGQAAHDEMEASPTAAGRGSAAAMAASGGMPQRSQSSFRIGEDLASGIGMSFTRRMASY